jgi:heme iron utilization protein
MLKELIHEICSTQYFAVLCTEDNGQPYSNLVAFAVTDDLKYLVFITGRNTSKYRNIFKNQRVSLLIDNRTNNPTDIEEATAITVIGGAHEEAEGGSVFRTAYLSRHPHLSQFASEADNTLIVVAVAAFIIARFDNTQRLTIDAIRRS